MWLWAELGGALRRRRGAPTRLDEWPTVSVLVAARNAARTIEDCVRAIQLTSYDRYEVVLVDDGSTDRTAELMAGLAAADPWIKLAGRSAAGRSAALNLALRHATGEVLVCAGTDSRFDRDTVKRLLQGFTDKHTGAVVPAGQLLRRAPARHGGPAGAGSIVAFPREVLEHAGGFLDDGPAAAQLEPVSRVRRAGYRVGFAPRALVCPGPRS